MVFDNRSWVKIKTIKIMNLTFNYLCYKEHLTVKEFGLDKITYSKAILILINCRCENLSDDFKTILKEESQSTK